MPDLSNTGETVAGSEFMRRDGGVRFPKPSAVDSFVAGSTISTNAGKTFGTNELVSGVRIKSDAANAEALFVGFNDGVSASDEAGATYGGFKLLAGEETFIDVDSLQKVFIMSLGGGETFSFMGS